MNKEVLEGNSELIKICPCHETQVPLLWTFKFPGAEYWCPACGHTEGMFGEGIDVSVTEELNNELAKWKSASKKYLSDDTEEWVYIL